MIKGTKEFLGQLVMTHQCPEHPDKALVVAWHKEGFYVIRCGGDHYPDEVTRQLSPTQEFKQGKRDAADPTFSLLPAVDLGTGERLPAEIVEALYRYARKYGLDADRGHVVLMYGKPYIGIDGYLYHADKEKVPYNLASRPLNEVERALYQVPEGAHAWVSKVAKGNQGGIFDGFGLVTQNEMTATSKKDKTKLASPVVAAHPWQLAQKRAEWQALRRAFPIGETTEEKEE